jgi:hypothetical protein
MESTVPYGRDPSFQHIQKMWIGARCGIICIFAVITLHFLAVQQHDIALIIILWIHMYL